MEKTVNELSVLITPWTRWNSSKSLGWVDVKVERKAFQLEVVLLMN